MEWKKVGETGLFGGRWVKGMILRVLKAVCIKLLKSLCFSGLSTLKAWSAGGWAWS